jgi:hypothetical protein
MAEQLKAAQGLVFEEQNRLRIAQAAEGPQRLITESLVKQLEIQREFGLKLAEAKSAGEIAKLQEAEKLALQTNGLALQTALTEKVKETQQPLGDIIKANTTWLADNARIKELVAGGITPALAESYVQIENSVKKEGEFYTLQIGILEGELARVDANSEIAKKIQEQIDKMRELQGLLPGKGEDAKGGAAAKDKAGKDKDANKYYDDLKAKLEEMATLSYQAEFAANALGDAFSSSFQGLISGSMTAKEALANFFKSIGDAFTKMASQMIADAIRMMAYKLIMSLAGGALGSLGGNFNAGAAGSIGGIAGGDGGIGSIAGNFKFADGGFVTGPTNAVVGEGGANEYVIPENRMGSALSRYSAGARGDAVINGADPTGGSAGGVAMAEATPQITINGGVMQFGGDDYIRKDQLPGIITQASKAGEARTLSRLKNSPGARRRIGI